MSADGFGIVDAGIYLNILNEMFNEWCTIESDPGVFTELINNMGVSSIQVEEVYSMEDDELMKTIKPEIYGFIFLFKWTKNIESRESLTMYDEDLFFARQIVNNACATQAILAIVLNSQVEIGSPLKEFYEFTRFLPSEDRGLAMSNSEELRKIHNSFSRPEPFIFKDDKKSQKKGDVYHFISYVPFKGNLYELDGLQKGPIILGKYSKREEWVELAKAEIQNRILKYSQKQINFNLMVVCEDLRHKKLRDNNNLGIERVSILRKLQTLGEQVPEQDINDRPDVLEAQSSDSATLHSRLAQIQTEIQDNVEFCASEQLKSSKRKEQNIRRKHNYVPMIIQILKTLSKKQILSELVDKAVEKKKDKKTESKDKK